MNNLGYNKQTLIPLDGALVKIYLSSALIQLRRLEMYKGC